jgi:hypothetical protein
VDSEMRFETENGIFSLKAGADGCEMAEENRG